MLLAKHIVVGVMTRGNFKTTCSEFRVHIFVFNHWNFPINERHYDMFAFQPGVFLVVRVYTHGCITHYCFGTGCGYNSILFLALFRVNNIIAKVVEFAVFFLVYHFFVAERGLCLRIPIHHSHSAIDEPFVVEVNKYADNAL